jgi:hypothetical protein
MKESLLEDMLRNNIDPMKDDWGQHLAMAEFAVNNSFNQSTSEASLFFPDWWGVPLDTIESGLRDNDNPAARTLCERVHENLKVARQHLQIAQDRMTTSANRKRRDVTYRVSDEVMLSTKNIRLNAVGTSKLLSRYVGPFSVCQVISNTVVTLDLPEHNKSM